MSQPGTSFSKDQETMQAWARPFRVMINLMGAETMLVFLFKTIKNTHSIINGRFIVADENDEELERTTIFEIIRECNGTDEAMRMLEAFEVLEPTFNINTALLLATMTTTTTTITTTMNANTSHSCARVTNLGPRSTDLCCLLLVQLSWYSTYSRLKFLLRLIVCTVAYVRCTLVLTCSNAGRLRFMYKCVPVKNKLSVHVQMHLNCKTTTNNAPQQTRKNNTKVKSHK